MRIRIGKDEYEELDPRLIVLSTIQCYREESKSYGYFLLFSFMYGNQTKFAMLTLEESRTFEQDIIREMAVINMQHGNT
jgi:hypothetical protein